MCAVPCLRSIHSGYRDTTTVSAVNDTDSSTGTAPGPMNSDVYEAPSAIHGMGIFAGRDFSKGERVVRIDDFRIVPEGSPDIDPDGRRLYYDDISGGRV